MSNIGYVYCLTIPRMPGVVKIGYTSKTIEQRLKDLDNTSVVEPFQVYYAGRVRNPLSVEKKIHEIYREWRIRSNREFFEVDAEQVKRVIQLAEVAGMGADEEKTPVEEDIPVENEMIEPTSPKNRSSPGKSKEFREESSDSKAPGAESKTTGAEPKSSNPFDKYAFKKSKKSAPGL